MIVQFNQAIDPNFLLSSEDNTQQTAKKIADLSIQSIKKVQLQIERQDLESISKILSSIQRISLFAKGDSQVMVKKFQNKMVRLSKFLILAEEYSDSSQNTANLTSEDYAVFISYNGRIHYYGWIMTYLKHIGAPTLLTTGNRHSEMAKRADMYLVISQEKYDFAEVATLSSQTAFDYALDTLFSVIYPQNFEENIRNSGNK